MANFFKNVSKGLQAVVGGLVAIAGLVLTHAPAIIPMLPPKAAGNVGVAVTVAGVIVGVLSHPPQTPVSGNKISPKLADALGVPNHNGRNYP